MPPSMEMLLSSNSTISLLSLRCPASGAGFVADAFHQAAVAGDDPGAVVDQAFAEFCREQTLRDGHADGGRQALAQRAGGHLDRGMFAVFRVAGGGGMELAEVFEIAMVMPHGR